MQPVSQFFSVEMGNKPTVGNGADIYNQGYAKEEQQIPELGKTIVRMAYGKANWLH